MDDDHQDRQYPLLGDLVPWPLLLITFCVSMTVLVVETWVGRQAGNDWWQAGTQNLDKPVYAAALCVIVGNTVRLVKEGFMWLSKEKARHEARVAARVAAEVTDKVTAEVTDKVTAAVTAEVTDKVTAAVTAEVADRVTAARDKAWVEWLKDQNITPPQTPPTSER